VKGLASAWIAAALFTACSDAPANTPVTPPDPGGPPVAVVPPAASPLTTTTNLPVGFPKDGIAATAPAGNALTEARAQLGKRLFFDKRLSRTNEIACDSCHHPELAFADRDAVSRGVEGRRGTRNAPALVNVAWNQNFFWDGRALTLEEQTGMPIQDPVEMDLPISEAVSRVAADDSYVQAFQQAYGQGPSTDSLRAALASFVRTLVSGDSPYDRHARGDDGQFSASARRGEALFFDEAAGCFHCHPPGALTNDGFFNNGTFDQGADTGRAHLTGRSGDVGKFKVPGLRNIAVTGPYMHDGSVPTLEAVIEQYARGGRGSASTDPQIKPLSLSDADKADLLSFLRSLTDADFLVDLRFRP
jgi:cytochrome c peroxidase